MKRIPIIALFFILLSISSGIAGDLGRMSRSLIFFNSQSASTTTRYITPGTGVSSGTESAVRQEIAMGGTLSQMRCSATAAPAGGTSWVIAVFVGGSASALTCTIAGSATTCSDLTNSVALARGNTFSLGTTAAGGTPTSSFHHCHAVFEG